MKLKKFTLGAIMREAGYDPGDYETIGPSANIKKLIQGGAVLWSISKNGEAKVDLNDGIFQPTIFFKVSYFEEDGTLVFGSYQTKAQELKPADILLKLLKYPEYVSEKDWIERMDWLIDIEELKKEYIYAVNKYETKIYKKENDYFVEVGETLVPLKTYLENNKCKNSEIVIALVKGGIIPIKKELHEFKVSYNPKEDKFFLPEISSIVPSNAIFKTIWKTMEIKYSQEIAKQEFEELKKVFHKKQLADFLAIPSIWLYNLLRDHFKMPEAGKIIWSYGDPKTGKSALHDLAMRFWFGYRTFISPTALVDKRKMSNFRFDVLNQTNLPLFFDEMEIVKDIFVQMIKAVTTASSMVTFRGKQNLEVTTMEYEGITWCFTSNRNLLYDLKRNVDREALKRRIYLNFYKRGVEGDVSDLDLEKEKTFNPIFEKLKTKGLIYEVLKRYTARQLKAKLEKHINQQQNLDDAILEFGKEIFKETFGFDFGEKGKDYQIESEFNKEEEQMKIYFAILNDAKRVVNGERDYFAKEIGDAIIVKNKKIYISSRYIDCINRIRTHELCGEFETLKDLAEKLEGVFTKETLKEFDIEPPLYKSIYLKEPVKMHSWAVVLPYFERTEMEEESLKVKEKIKEFVEANGEIDRKDATTKLQTILGVEESIVDKEIEELILLKELEEKEGKIRIPLDKRVIRYLEAKGNNFATMEELREKFGDEIDGTISKLKERGIASDYINGYVHGVKLIR